MQPAAGCQCVENGTVVVACPVMKGAFYSSAAVLCLAGIWLFCQLAVHGSNGLFSCTADVSKLPGLRKTAVAARAAAEALKTRTALQAARPKRRAAAAAAMRVLEAAAADNSVPAVEELAPAAKKSRGRPRLAPEVQLLRQLEKAAAARNDICVASITVASKKEDIKTDVYDRLFTWVQAQAAGGLALERGGTYGHLHIQGVAKVFASTPQQVNKQIKVSV